MKMACISLRHLPYVIIAHSHPLNFAVSTKNFLLELADYTFVENGAAEWAAQMENNLGSLGSALSWMKTMFLNTATPEFLANVKFDLNHGDFSPWNCVVENGKLAVFDWEYASAPKPAFLDAVHFILKPILLKKTA